MSGGKREERREELPVGMRPRARPIPRKAGMMNLERSSEGRIKPDLRDKI